VFGLKFVAFDAFSMSLGIGGMKAQAMFAGDQRECLVKITAQFVRRASFAEIIASDSEAAAESGIWIFKAADVVALPAMERDGNASKLGQGSANIHAETAIAFLCEDERAFEMLGGFGHKSFRERTLGSGGIRCQESRA